MISATTSEAEPRNEEIASHATTAQTSVTAVPTDATVPTDETALTNEVNHNFKIFLFAQTSWKISIDRLYPADLENNTLFLNLFQKYYPVKDIVREMKKGKRCKLSSQQVLDLLESLGPNEWEVEHRTHIHKACCSWLMGNCTK